MGEGITTRGSSSRIGFETVLLISLLLCGCGDQYQSDTSAKSDGARSSELNRSTDPAITRAVPRDAGDNAAREQRIARLTEELSLARAEQTRLLQQQAETEARIAAHQEKGMELLNTLKSQSRTQQAQDAGFEVKAKSELEAVLAQDDSMTMELDVANEELARVESRIDAIDKELEALRATAKDQKPAES